MRYAFCCRLFIGLALVMSICFPPEAQSREIVNLDGIWDFATDPDNRGETEKWYEPTAKLPAMPLPGYAPEANGKIRVPGIWDNQGYGKESEKLRHDFAGKGWYRRTVEIPKSWNGKRAFLVITGVSRYAKVWIDNHFLGEHIGFLSTFEYDLTPYVVPGNIASITIQVDSKQRWEVDSMLGTSSIADYVFVDWGGIWGHVRLEARADAWLSDLFPQPDVHKSACTASATVNGRADLPNAVKLEILDVNQRVVAEATSTSASKTAATNQSISVTANIPNAKLWSPDSPTLYTARLKLLRENDVLDTMECRFGMRQFTLDGYHVLLNGKRIMLRGYGDDHIYPEQMAMSVDKDLHLKRLRTIRSYGFNHVRNHSAIMPPEYYDACDEIGVIATAEFPIVYAATLPGVGGWWRERVTHGITDPGPALDTYRREWTAAIKQNRNHPSIFCWIMGNELYDESPKPRSLFADIARQLDPTRPFADSDGLGGIPNEQIDRDTLDIWSVQFNEWCSIFDNPDKLKTQQPKKPMLEHEAGNYVTFSRPDLPDQFQHNFKPFWLTEGRKRLQSLGLLREANQWAEKSERLYALLHKYNLEALRKNPFLSGYHWWLFQDYWTSANGLVDHYFRPKSILPTEVLKFNNDVVLLQDGLQPTYRGRDRLKLKFLASNFSPDVLNGTFTYKVMADAKTLSTEDRSAQPVPQGDLAHTADVDVELPDVSRPVLLTIAATWTSGTKRYANNWTARLYPASITPQTASVLVFGDEEKTKQYSRWNVKAMPAQGALPANAVYLAGSLDKRTLDAMNRGATLLLLNGSGQCQSKTLIDSVFDSKCVVTFEDGRPILKPHAMTFRTSWWKAGEKEEENNTGTYVCDHPTTREMAPDGWCDVSWFNLIEGGCKYDLEKAPARPHVIIRALTSLMLPADQSILFEVSVGKGCLIVSGLNHRRAEGRPENDWLIARLLDYAAQSPHPEARWPLSFLANEAKASIAPDGCLPGFRRLLSNQGEVSKGYSYRSDSDEQFVCRQNQVGNRITWETAAVTGKSSGDSVTFVFAGGLGYASEPKTAGFVLEIDGNDILHFDLPEPKTWRSNDKRVQLQFDSMRTVSVDHFGFFRLTVPQDMLKTDVPCVLGVRSLGTGSQRWFGLNPYR